MIKLNRSGLVGNTEMNLGTAIACFLAQEGADINYANHKGKSPLDLISNTAHLQLVKSFFEKHRYVYKWNVALCSIDQHCMIHFIIIE